MATYKEAGVDISAGEDTVRRIKPLVRSTFTEGVLTDIGAFGAFFAPPWRQYDDPILVSSVDGVGTKLAVAVACDRHDTVGQDLVNHCVNDIAVCGATPLFFMDYFAAGSLDPERTVSVIEGFATACRENGCALIGGEMAEMPGMYRVDDYDIAGTIVGMVDRSEIVDGSTISDGDVLIGLPSTGLHTNGFSLARHVLLSRFDVHDKPEELGGESVGEVLLRVHRSYLGVIRRLLEQRLAVGFSHITGGGIAGNTRRILPDGLEIDVQWDAWERPAIFRLIQELGSVPESDMRSTFNLGIGLVAVVPVDRAAGAEALLRAAGEEPIIIGRIVREARE
ncbi:MAG: phosphoribosylformylglycinamidine cyclo-ligase [Rhodothermales bacterium]